MITTKVYNATLRNLAYRLRKFKDDLPNILEAAIYESEDAIVSAIANDQLYRRGINGKEQKIMDYAPYTPRTIKNKIRKGQPTTRVTLRDTGAFHKSMFVVVDENGFYVTSEDDKTQYLVPKYGDNIFRLTDKNLTRIVRSHVCKVIIKKLKEATKNERPSS